jgi:hypothetical protein
MRPRPGFRWLAVVAVIAASALAMLGLPAVASAQSDSMSVSPTSGPPGQVVTLDGEGFGAYAGSEIEIDVSIDYGNGNWDLLVAGAAYPVPDANGNFAVNVTIPSNAPPGDLLAISSVTEPEADAFFTVTEPSGTGTSAPAAPSNLTATAVDPNDIRLNWQDNSDNETGFEINNGVVSRDVGANSTTYTWGGLAPGTYMCFHIRAYNNAGDSAWDPDVSPWYVCTTTPKSQSAPQPTIYWSRTSGPPGTHFTLTGNGWVPEGTVRVQFPSNGIFYGRVSWPVDSHGYWQQNFSTGDTPPGKYKLRFSETSGRLHVTGSFKVLVAPTPETFTWGDYLTYLEQWSAGFAGADESLECIRSGSTGSFSALAAGCLSLLWKDAPPTVRTVLDAAFDSLKCVAVAKSGSEDAIAVCISGSLAELVFKVIHAALNLVPGGRALLDEPFPVQPD